MTVVGWSPRLPAVLAGPHRPTWRVSAHHDDLPDEGLLLDVGALELEWDESRAPRVRANLGVVAPADPAHDAILDGRTGVRLHFHAGHLIGGVDDRVLVADLVLRRRSEDDPVGVTRLEAASDETLVVDCAPSSIFSTLPSNSPRGHIQNLITSCIPSAEFVVTAPSTTSVSFPAGTVGDKWSMIDDLADGIGDVDVYDDGLRLWHIEPRPELADEADLTLEVGVGGTVVTRSSVVDREEWHNRVILVYRWTDAGTDHEIQAVRSVTSGPFAAVAGNVKTWTETRDVPATQARADQAAESLVRRMSSRGRTLTVEAVAVPWLRPGMTVALRTRTGTARHLVASVLLDGTGRMRFTTRYPDSTETIGA